MNNGIGKEEWWYMACAETEGIYRHTLEMYNNSDTTAENGIIINEMALKKNETMARSE